jgi:hypothetical protein
VLVGFNSVMPSPNWLMSWLAALSRSAHQCSCAGVGLHSAGRVMCVSLVCRSSSAVLQSSNVVGRHRRTAYLASQLVPRGDAGAQGHVPTAVQHVFSTAGRSD